MNIQENKLNESELELVFDLERSDIESDLQNSAKRISESVNIPGFRKGQATYDVVCRHIGGEAKVYEEVLQRIAGKVLVKAMQDKKLETVGRPEISIQKMVPPFGVSFKAKIALMPHVELGDISKIKIKKADPKVEDADVQKVIDNLRQMRVKEAVVDRETKDADKVVLDFEIKREGVAIENGSAKDYPLVIGEKRFIPGFEEQIVGLKAGDTKKFELEFPKQYFEKNLAGKKAQFEVKVKQVFEIMVPDFDDEFAKQMGEYKSSKDLRAQIVENLKHERAREEKEKFEIGAMQELVKLSTIGALPESLVSEEVDKMIHELEHDVSSQSIKFDDYLSSIKKSKDDLKKDFHPKAEDRIKMMLVARAFGTAEIVKIDEKQVDDEIAVSKKAHANNPEMLAKFENAEYRDYLRNALTSRAIFAKLAKKIGNQD
ncbi:MAG: trigger factor [Parcubacteria group bacterium CG22_combo_CG10-13_8_21_14_all_41_9]|nr:MAG: trigger factor [Parcubacteria group bacterium CG22_combo_CG10-13_8_21_14_all_41_9]